MIYSVSRPLTSKLPEVYETKLRLLKGGLASIIIYNQILSSLEMLYKIVLDNQIRVFDCKEELTLEALVHYVKKTFPGLTAFSFYYIDEDGDQITL